MPSLFRDGVPRRILLERPDGRNNQADKKRVERTQWQDIHARCLAEHAFKNQLPVERTPLERLQRYLVEIIAYNLHANFNEINRAMGQPYDPSLNHYSCTSFLDYDEQVSLFDLAYLVRQLRDYYMSGHDDLIDADERRRVFEDVIQPAREIEINTEFLLDLISTYAE